MGKDAVGKDGGEFLESSNFVDLLGMTKLENLGHRLGQPRQVAPFFPTVIY